MGVGGRAHLTTPLPVFQFPRQGADPPPTSRGASARVPIPQARSARSLQPRAITTHRSNPGLTPFQPSPGKRALTSPRCPYLAPEYPAGGRARRHLSRRESSPGPRAPRVAGPPLPIIPQAMKCRGMASLVLCSLTKWKGSFSLTQTQKETKVMYLRQGAPMISGYPRACVAQLQKKKNQ